MVPTHYKEIRLRVGLEVHQQINSEKKLFCDCKPDLFHGDPEIIFLRGLRPTQSELGQIDPAAYFEFKKGFKILYEGNRETACLVEMDEEPPHQLNHEVLKTSIIIALMLGAKPVNEIHIMRKMVIDGSNTTGFQRSSVVALNGEVKTKDRVIPIIHIGLEEDAARKMIDGQDVTRYRVDRLCIPLVEVATAPVIKEPHEAENVAHAIGKILRATGKAKRGIGTIRQDLNISIYDGSPVEIKGVQELELVSLIVEQEIQRQLNLLKIRDVLIKRNVRESDIKDRLIDVTQILKGTKCRVIQVALKKEKRVMAVKLPKFEGFLKQELIPNVRFGTELADVAKFWGRVGGIFHSDELPAYGVTAEELDDLKKAVKAKAGDVVVFVAGNTRDSTDALKAVVERARQALKGVPPETRAAKSDGTTRYTRPRPGAARMYPETDIPPVQIPLDLVYRLSKELPELPEHRMKRLMRDYGLNKKLTKQILDSEFNMLFEQVIQDNKVSPTFVAVLLTETMKALRREGILVENVSETQLQELFHSIGCGEVAKEAAPDIIVWLSKNRGGRVKQAIKALDLGMLREPQLERVIENLIKQNRKLLLEHAEKAFGILMGLVMKQVRGRSKAEVISEIVRRKLKGLQ